MHVFEKGMIFPSQRAVIVKRTKKTVSIAFYGLNWEYVETKTKKIRFDERCKTEYVFTHGNMVTYPNSFNPFEI